jgi:hypothetical protein
MSSTDPFIAAFYRDNDIIPVPSENTRLTRKVRVFLDSRYRDVRVFPSPSSFTILLDTAIERVLSAKLVNYRIPVNNNMISKANNLLSFSEDTIKFATDGTIAPFTTVKTITVPSGNYDPTDLASVIQGLMNAQSLSNIAVTYDAVSQTLSFRSELTNRVTLVRNLGFSILCNDANTCARIIGFADGEVYRGAMAEPVTLYFNSNTLSLNVFDNLAVNDNVVIADRDYALDNVVTYIDPTNNYVQLLNNATNNIFVGSLNHGKVVAPMKFTPKIVASNDYIILEIDGFGLNMEPVTQPVGRAFAILTSNNLTEQYAPYEKKFNPPLVALKQFKMKFKNFDGQLCDFDNVDNFVELLLTVEKHPQML